MHPSRRRRPLRGTHVMRRVSVPGLLLAAGYCILVILGMGQASGDVGDLGPPPADFEIHRALTELYSAGLPLGTTFDVQLDGPILTGPPTERANPPPRPWCVRCGYPDQGRSLMYPVAALVTVTVTQGLESSALSADKHVVTKTTYNGTSCAGATFARYCPAYYFYRDTLGNWQVA